MENTARERFYPTFGESVKLILRVLVVSLLVGLPVISLWLIIREGFEVQSELFDSFIILILYSIPFILVGRLGVKRIRLWDQKDYSLNWKLPTAKTSLIIVITCLAVTMLMDPLDSLIPIPQEFLKQMQTMAKPDIFSFLTIVIAAPILEEILFRGVILEGFLKNYNPQKAILLSAVIFGGAHLNPWQAYGAFLIGIFIGWLYWKTRSLIPGILIHFINNVIGFFALLYLPGQSSIRQWMGDSTVYWSIIGLSAIIALIGIHWMNRRIKFPIKEEMPVSKQNTTEGS